MKHSEILAAGICGLLLAASATGEERTVLRPAVMRSGPGAYYEAVTSVPENSRVNTGEVKPAWINTVWKTEKGWLPDKAFQKPKAGLDYGGVFEGEKGVVVSSVDIAAATKGMITTKFQDRYKVDFAVADQLDGIRANIELVQAIMTDLQKSSQEIPYSRLPRQSFKNNVILRPDAETLLGRALVAHVATNGLSQPALVAYVNAVAAAVGAKTERYDLTYRVGVLREAGINGFGLPGGYVLLSDGLLAQVQDEAELACVLGHEMAHASLFHGLREFTKRGKQRRADSVFDELDSISGGGSDDEIEADLDRLAKTSYLKVIGGRAREDELEADLFGVAFAASAGYDPNAMLDVLQRVSEKGTETDVFRHHPSVRDRIAVLQAAIKKYDLGGSGKQRFADRFRMQMAAVTATSREQARRPVGPGNE